MFFLAHIKIGPRNNGILRLVEAENKNSAITKAENWAQNAYNREKLDVKVHIVETIT